MQHNFKSYESSDGIFRHNRSQRRGMNKPAVITDGMAFEPKEAKPSVEQAEELDAFMSMFRELPDHADHGAEEFPLIQRLVECR